MREIAAMTPGPYFHIGGDEVKTLTPEQYRRFVERVQGIVKAHGKQVIGWDEIAHATLLPDTVVQYWRPDASITPPPSTKLVLSPANRIYLDMKYDDATVLGLNWAGNVDVQVPYEWNPATLLPKVPETAILGVEAPIWSETLATMDDLEFMAFPRLAAVAEVAWSPQSARQWAEFKIGSAHRPRAGRHWGSTRTGHQKWNGTLTGLLDREAVEQSVAAGATQILLAAARDACAEFHDVGLSPPPWRSWWPTCALPSPPLVQFRRSCSRRS